MPMIQPSPSTQALWGDRTKAAIILELTSITVVSFTLVFAVVNSIQASETWSAYPAWTDWPSDPSDFGVATAIIVVLHVLPPVIALVGSAVNISLYAKRSLHPVYVLVSSLVLLLGWACVVFWWCVFGGDSYWFFFNIAGEDAAEVVYWLMVAGGIASALLNLVYMSFAASVVDRNRKARKTRMTSSDTSEWNLIQKDDASYEDIELTKGFSREVVRWSPRKLDQLPNRTIAEDVYSGDRPKSGSVSFAPETVGSLKADDITLSSEGPPSYQGYETYEKLKQSTRRLQKIP